MRNKVLFVIGSLDYGGAERHLVRVLPGLATNWNVSIFTLSHPGAQADELRKKGVHVYSSWFAPKPNAGLIFRLVRQICAMLALFLHLLRHRPNIIHYFLPQAYMVAAPCALLLGIRIHVMSRRSRNYYQAKYPFARRMELILHHFMTAVLGNSREVISDLRSENINEAKLGIIYNALAPEEMELRIDDTGDPTLEKIPSDAVVLIKVANLISYKGHSDLIEAVALMDERLEWRLICVGSDSGILESLKSLAGELGVADRIIWLGQRKDVNRLLRLADIGVLASHEEGFSNSILEYMAAQLPVVVTAVGGAGEAVENGKTGLLVPPRSPQALAEALVSLMDPELRIKMGLAGRQRLEAKFSYEQCISDYDSLYKSLITKSGIPKALRPTKEISNGGDVRVASMSST